MNESWDNGAEDFLARAKTVPAAVLNLYAAHWCQSEVDNGGLYQFFWNTTGLLAPEASAAFRIVGLGDWSSLLTEAMTYFGDQYPRERSARLLKLPEDGGRPRASWDPFDSLDERFYASEDASRWQHFADTYAFRAARG